MNYYIENPGTDACYNLALEQFIFDSLDRQHSYFMLWQNENSIIVGKHQNTIAEINAAFVKKHKINLVRRLSGGGAVYHDLGNINYTIITDTVNNETIDFHSFCLPVKDALVSFGVPVLFSGRNDLTVDGLKVSGNAQYVRQGRVMHHGTILYDSNLDMLCGALNVTNDKIESKGIKSVRSRVTNIRPYMNKDMTTGDFFISLKTYLFSAFDLINYDLCAAEETEVEMLIEKKYCGWSWNYGASPPYNVRKERRIEGCGKIEILLDVEKEGIINNISFYGDFFSNDDPDRLAEILKGHHFEYNELAETIKDINISRYFYNLDIKTFLALLFE